MKRLQFALAGAVLFAWACAAQAQSAGGPMYSPYANPQMMGSPYGNPYGQPPNGYNVQQAGYPMMQGSPEQGMLYGSSGGGPMPMGGPDGGGCPCGNQPTGAECSDDGTVHYGYFNAEGFYARRTNQSKNQPIIVDTLAGGTIIDTHDLDFIYEPGVRATAGYMFGQGVGLEGTYFGQFDFRRGVFVTDPNSQISVAGNLGNHSVDFDAVPNISTTYRSQINNGELNFVLPYGSFQFLGGFRVLQVQEMLDINGGTTGVETSDYVIHTMNNLYGSQIGARGQWQIWRMTFDAQCKAGLFENYTNQQQTIGDIGNTISYRDTNGTKNDPAFVGEVGVEMTLPVSSWLTARMGYTAVWIQEVALAPNQLSFDAGDPTAITPSANAGTGVNMRSGIILHGFTAGFEARW
jgi:hypothetical protein